MSLSLHRSCSSFTYEMKRPTTKKIGQTLLIAWLLSPIPMGISAILIWDELSLAASIASALITLPYVVWTSWFLWRFFHTKLIRTKLGRTLSFTLPIITLVNFLIKNLTPRKIGLSEDLSSDSPFDLVWYTLPQTAFGFPSPVARFYEEELPVAPFGSQIIDIASFFGNIWFLFGSMFLIVGIHALYLNWRSTKLIVNQSC